MTDKQLDEAVRVMGMKVTKENKKNMRARMAQARGLFKKTKIRGTLTELYKKISTPVLKKEDFVFAPPKDAVLKESLFGGLLGGKPLPGSAASSPPPPATIARRRATLGAPAADIQQNPDSSQ